MKNISTNRPSHIEQFVTPENVAAVYWNQPVLRKEAQKVYDEFAEGINTQAQACMKLDLIVSFVMSKFQIDPKECADWCNAKMEEAQKKFEEAQKQSQATTQTTTQAPKLVVEG